MAASPGVGHLPDEPPEADEAVAATQFMEIAPDPPLQRRSLLRRGRARRVGGGGRSAPECAPCAPERSPSDAEITLEPTP
eukprot:950387-Pyramimonas_sp.AAC.1